MTPGPRSPRGGRRCDERGSITPFVLIVSIFILALAGLVIDGGRQLNAHGRAIAYAEEAARAGAQEIDVYDPALDLDTDLAMKAAGEYCDTAMAADAQLTACDAQPMKIPGTDFTGVQVRTQVDIKTILLGLFNKPELEASGVALARPVTGITGPNSVRLDQLPPPAVATPGGGQIEGGPGGPGDPGGVVPTAPLTNPGDPVSPCTTVKPTPTDKPTKGATDKPTKGATDKPTKTPKPRRAAGPSPSQCATPGPGAG